MQKIMGVIDTIKSFMNNLSQKRFFFEIYCLIICFISILSWAFLGQFGMSLMIVIAAFALFFMDDLKYALPVMVNFIFVNSNSFKLDTVPVALIISGAILILTLFGYIIKNKKKYHLGGFGLNFIFLSIIGILPIFWCNLVTKGNEYLYFMYFSYLLYFFIYFFVFNNVKGNIINELSITLSYLGVLLAFECIIQAIRDINLVSSIFDLYLILGWGLCNEAGIMILVVLPFSFYMLYNSKPKDYYINIIKIILMCVGLFLTMSRASYLVGIVELALLSGLLIIFSKNKKRSLIIISAILLILIITGIILHNSIIDMYNKVFELKLTGNGREEIWRSGIDVFKESFLYKIFGKGIVAIIDSNDRVVVFHSTFLQALATTGIIGLLILLWHLVKKYLNLWIHKSKLSAFLFVGYICVDIYGLVDNTYGMYYFMIVLCIILAVLDRMYLVESEVDDDEGSTLLRESENA